MFLVRGGVTSCSSGLCLEQLTQLAPDLSSDESAQPALLELTGSMAAQRPAGVNVTKATGATGAHPASNPTHIFGLFGGATWGACAQSC